VASAPAFGSPPGPDHPSDYPFGGWRGAITALACFAMRAPSASGGTATNRTQNAQAESDTFVRRYRKDT
jgi:hypothetical protein